MTNFNKPLKSIVDMYFAVNQNVNHFETYLSFLAEIMRDGNKHYIEVFKEIINETKKLIQTGDYYSVLNERFEIVNYLSKNEDLIKSISLDEISNSDFEKLYKCLENQNAIENVN